MSTQLVRFTLAAALILFPAAVHAQFDSGTVLGRVVDQSGATAPGTSVTLTNLATQQQTVAVFGGPIVRSRAFFFFNYEGFRQVQRTVTFSTIPTMAQRQGVMGRPVVNPLTGELYADGVIPASAITPFAASVLAGLPAPTRDGTSNNYDALPRRQDTNDKFDIKVDHGL